MMPISPPGWSTSPDAPYWLPFGSTCPAIVTVPDVGATGPWTGPVPATTGMADVGPDVVMPALAPLNADGPCTPSGAVPVWIDAPAPAPPTT